MEALAFKQVPTSHCNRGGGGETANCCPGNKYNRGKIQRMHVHFLTCIIIDFPPTGAPEQTLQLALLLDLVVVGRMWRVLRINQLNI